jgi:hypothetical protein
MTTFRTGIFRFNRTYGVLTLLLLVTEIVIALYVHDAIIRPYIGDLLVVILIYCCVRCFTRIPVIPAAAVTLAFAVCIETLQYFHIVEVLGLSDSRFASTVIGTSFAWMDIIAYIAGILVILVTEAIISAVQKKTRS